MFLECQKIDSQGTHFYKTYPSKAFKTVLREHPTSLAI